MGTTGLPPAVLAAGWFVFDFGHSASNALEAKLLSTQGRSRKVFESLLDYFPTRTSAVQAYEKLVADCSENFRRRDEDEGVPSLSEPLTDAELGRRRYYHSWKNWGSFAQLGPRWGPGLSLYCYLIPDHIGTWLRRLLDDLGLFHAQSSSGVFDGLKHLSDVMKKQGPLLSPHWRFAVNLETLGGYRAPLPMSRFLPDLRGWAQGDRIHTINGDEDLFLSWFGQGIRNFLQLAPNVVAANSNAHTLDEFVSDPSLWGNDGATQVPKNVFVSIQRHLHKLHRNKNTTALLLSPAEVKKMILSPHTQVLRAIEKLESGKVRAVANADDNIYLKMAFVSDWLETALKGHVQTTLFMNASQRADMWQRFASDTGLSTAKVPLDQSHFDWQPNKRMLAVVLREISSFCDRHCSVDPSNRRRVNDLIYDTLIDRTGMLEVTEGSSTTTIPVEKGVMSGWRWTALIDTLCNVGELFAAQQLCRTWGFGETVNSFVAQGDDDQVSSPSFSTATVLTEAYRAMNFEINPGKFFIDTSRDEFLRLVAEPSGVRGYPSRAINNILWRNPINPDPLPGELTIRTQMSQWVLLINRGCDRSRVLHCMLEDIQRRNELSRQVAIDYLLTPAPYGGCGLVGTGLVQKSFITISAGKISRNFSIDSHLPGLTEVRRSATALRIPEEVVTAAVKDVLPVQSLVGEVEPRVIKQVSVAIAPNPGYSTAYVPRKYEFVKTVPSFLQSRYLSFLVRHRDYSTLRSLCDPRVLPFFDKFFSSLTKNAFNDWLLGRLDVQSPTILGYGPEQTAVLWSGYVNAILQQAAHGIKVTSGYFRAAATVAVWALRTRLSNFVPVSN